MTIEDLFSADDRAVARWAFQGRHHRDFLGIPATQRHVTVNMMEIFRVANGKVQEVWLAPDTLGLLQQLGVIPAMGSGGEE